MKMKFILPVAMGLLVAGMTGASAQQLSNTTRPYPMWPGPGRVFTNSLGEGGIVWGKTAPAPVAKPASAATVSLSGIMEMETGVLLLLPLLVIGR